MLKCDYCGVVSDDVSEEFDPYLLEINNEEVLENYCSDCSESRLYDI